MAEDGEKQPDFFVVRKGEGIKGHTIKKELENNPKKDDEESFPRPFNEVQEELRSLISSPNPQKEKELKMERAKLVRAAQDQGIFKQLKQAMAEVQVNNDFRTAYDKVNDPTIINIENLENFERGVRGWNNAFEGMLDEYRDVAVLNMELAALRASGKLNTPRAQDLIREIDVRGWGVPPQGLEGMAKSYFEKIREQKNPPQPSQQEKLNNQMMAYLAMLQGRGGVGGLTAEDFAKVMGKGTPEQQRAIYEKVEEGAYAPVDMTIEVPYFLLVGDDEVDRKKQEGEWKARAELWSFAAYKQKTTSYEKLMENPEGFAITNEVLETAMKIEGVFEATALYAAIISTNRDISFLDDPEKPVGLTKVFDIKTIEQFNTFRNGMREYLKNKGITDQAKTAESIAWNLIYATNVLEEFDTKYDEHGRPNNHDSLIPLSSPSHFKNPATWMVMHPQERLLGKATGKNPEAMGQVGEWSLQFNKENLPQILPQKTIGNALREVKLKRENMPEDMGRKFDYYIKLEESDERKIRPKGKEREIDVFEVLKSVGLDILDSQQSRILVKDIAWNQVSNNPFAGYYLEAINPASKLFAVIMKGQQSGIDGQELGNICRKLKIDKKTRENILKIWFGIKAKSRGLDYINQGGVWPFDEWSYAKGAFITKNPNFFK